MRRPDHAPSPAAPSPAAASPATPTGDDPHPWRAAWQDALYGPDGFYRREEGPVGHFTTSAHGPLGAVLAEAVAALADREGCTRVVDVGCGRGELLTHLAGARPDLALTGIDVVARPPGLPETIGWLVGPGGPGLPDGLRALSATLVLAHEWLDVIPCTVGEVDDRGRLREVLVARDGTETLGGTLAPGDLDWVRRWWPEALNHPATGHRVEVGTSRDVAWTDLVSRLDSGVAVAVDYGHSRGHRPGEGTLTAYARGAQTQPRPDGSVDLTAHVAMDSLDADEVRTQRDVLHALGLRAATPEHSLAATDPVGYLADLARASAGTALTDPGGLGGFLWATRRVRAGR